MRNLNLLATAAIAAFGISASSAPAATLIGTFSGNTCGGTGGINNCYATTAGTVVQGNPGTAGSSPLIARIEANGNGSAGSSDISTLFSTVTGTEFNIIYSAATNSLSFTYAAGAGDPAIHYYGIFQANTYDLFYDANAITSGTINLSTLFANNPGWSHIDFYDTATPGVPEPATWAMMLIGFAGIGYSMRRRSKSRLSRAV